MIKQNFFDIARNVVNNIRFVDIAKHVANKTNKFDTSVCDEVENEAKNKIYNVANLIKNENVFVRISLNSCKKSTFDTKFD